jgi:hypothetical protein
MFNIISSSSNNTYTVTYPGISTSITTGGVSNNNISLGSPVVKSKITIPGTDILVNDDWQNNMCVWFIKKYGLERMLEFIEENPIYLEFLDRSFSDYLKDMKRIVNRDKKIEQILSDKNKVHI